MTPGLALLLVSTGLSLQSGASALAQTTGTVTAISPQLSDATVSVAPLPPTAHPKYPDVALNDVACTPSGTCFAVGAFDRADSGQRALVETLQDGQWTAAELPLPRRAKPTSGGSLTAISCAGPSLCAAVGAYSAGRRGPQPMVATWDGLSWSVTSPRLPAGAVGLNVDPLVDVSCGGPSSCVAVGTYITRHRRVLPLMVTLRSGRWKSATGRLPRGAQSGELWAVDCGAPRSCVAVGASEPRVTGPLVPQHPLAQVLSGTRWRPSRPPVPRQRRTGFMAAVLNDVSCAGKKRCTALGTYHRRTREGVRNTGLVEVLTGARWKPGSVSPPVGNRRNIVMPAELTCPAARACVGVGTHAPTRDAVQPAVVRISGRNASGLEVPPVTESPRRSGYLSDVACGSPSACVGVGYDQVRDGTALIASLHGKEVRASAAALPPDAHDAVLYGVAMQSGTTAVAVGIVSTSRSEGLLVTGIKVG